MSPIAKRVVKIREARERSISLRLDAHTPDIFKDVCQCDACRTDRETLRNLRGARYILRD